MSIKLLSVVLLAFVCACSTSGDGDSLGGSVGTSGPFSDAEASTGDPLAGESSDMTTASDASDDIATESGVADETSLPTPEPEQPPVQSGLLTAGDYDDQLNPEQYQAYARDALQVFAADAQVPALDLEQRVQLSVVDADGEPHAGARVQVTTNQDSTLELHTASDGTLWLYPGMDNLPDSLALTIQNQTGDVQLEQTVDTNTLNDERVISVTLSATAIPSTQLDLALVIDTTGSMGDELNYLKAELTDIINELAQSNPAVSIRVGLIVYRDIGDTYVVRSHAFTSNMADAQAAIDSESFAGGGDYPEAMDQALETMLTLDWRDNATQVALLVADAPPHTENIHALWSAAREAREASIHIVPVAASGVADEAEYLMRTMAALTQGRYLFLTDDSGIGNPHEEPTIDCYLVTRLDGLISRVLQSLLTGERLEPDNAEVIRTVGHYDNGVCSDDEQ